MTEVDEHGRAVPLEARDEVEGLLGFLELQRGTIAWKTRGLDAAGLSATLPPTSMTLGGLLKHLAWVEDDWCSRKLHGNPPAPPWDTVDWSADENWEWSSAASDSPDSLRALWEAAVTRSRALVAEALAEGGPDRLASSPSFGDGPRPNLRWILLHLIEEYARHAGHADLLRESVDGLTGE